jgi:hypothetical protein
MSRWCSNQLSYAPERFEACEYSVADGSRLPRSRRRFSASARRRARRARRCTWRSTWARRCVSLTSTVKVIQAQPLTDWVCTPITFIFSRQTRRRCRAAGPGGPPPRPPRPPGRRAAAGGRRAPLDLDHALGLARLHSRKLLQSRRCTLTPLPARDKARNASGGAGLQQRASWVISESSPTTSTPPLGRGSPCAGLAAAPSSSASGSGSGGRSSGLDVAQRQLVLAHGLEQRVGVLKPSCRPGDPATARCLPSRCSSFSTISRPRAMVSCACWALNQARTLALGAVAGQVAQLGIEPVARRPALLGGGDLHRLAVLQRRVQRHHGAVHARAAAAVAQVWCAPCRQSPPAWRPAGSSTMAASGVST